MDPIANMITALKNASMAKKAQAAVPYAKFLHQIADLLLKEGYIADVKAVGEGAKKQLVVDLLYTQTGAATSAKKPRITDLKRESKPSRRVYGGWRDIQSVLQGRGMAVLSTPKGLLTDKQARKEKVGGELLFKIW